MPMRASLGQARPLRSDRPFKRKNAYAYIDAARVAANVQPAGHLPSLSHAQILAPLSPDEQRELAPDRGRGAELVPGPSLRSRGVGFHERVVRSAQLGREGLSDPDRFRDVRGHGLQLSSFLFCRLR